MTSQPSPRPASRREVRITRLLRAPRELVFNTWIDPDQVASWWAPTDYEIPRETVEIEPHVGGRIHFAVVERAGGAVYPVRFTILEIAEPELLVLASDPQPEIGLVYPMITRAIFEAERDGTLVTVTQGPHSEQTQDGASAGWLGCLDKLERVLRSLETGRGGRPAPRAKQMAGRDTSLEARAPSTSRSSAVRVCGEVPPRSAGHPTR